MTGKGGIAAVRQKPNRLTTHAIASIVPGRVADVTPLVPLDKERQRIWDEVVKAFDGTDHLRASDSGLVQSYVDAIYNYTRVRATVEERWDQGLTPNALRALYGTMDAQARLVGMLGRELGFGPMARNRLGGFVPNGGDTAIESFTTANPGRATR